jgi:hypothetical protein
LRGLGTQVAWGIWPALASEKADVNITGGIFAGLVGILVFRLTVRWWNIPGNK